MTQKNCVKIICIPIKKFYTPVEVLFNSYSFLMNKFISLFFYFGNLTNNFKLLKKIISIK